MNWKWILRYRILRREKPWTDPEPAVTAALSQMTGDLFVDVGSNRKRYSQLLQKNFRKIVTVDPNPRWKADYRVALTDHLGSAWFYEGDGQGGADGLLDTPHIRGKDWKTRCTRAVRLLRFDDLGLDADLVKIDVEGTEFQVMGGMRIHRPKTLVVELHDERRRAELIDRGRHMGYSEVGELDAMHYLFTGLHAGVPA